MAKTKPSTIAKDRLDVRRTAVEEHEAREALLSQKVDEHKRKADAGDLSYQAVEHIEDEAQLAGERRWLEAQRPHLIEDQKVHQSHVLADSVGAVLAQREALGGIKAQTVETIRKALDEYTEAVEEHNSDLAGLIGNARKAGLIEGEADPTLPVLFGGGEHGHPRALIVNGERYAAVRADQEAVVREARK